MFDRRSYIVGGSDIFEYTLKCYYILCDVVLKMQAYF